MEGAARRYEDVSMQFRFDTKYRGEHSVLEWGAMIDLKSSLFKQLDLVDRTRSTRRDYITEV
jgi:hypothetical protein